MRTRSFEIVLVFVAVVLGAPAAYADPTLVLENASSSAWSPDGGSLACVRSFPDWEDDANAQIWLVPVGGAPARLGDMSDAFWPLWLSDGQRIVYYNSRNGLEGLIYEFVVVDLQGGNPVAWEVPQVWDDPGIYLSPDRRSVLYTQRLSGVYETWSLDLTNGARTLVVAEAGGVISPDGEWIAYVDSQSDLVVARLGQPPVRNLGRGVFATWTPDSRFLVYTHVEGTGTSDLVIASREGTYSRDLTDDLEWELHPSVSPSGSSVAYTRTVGDTGLPSIYTVNLPPVAVEDETWTRIKQIYR